MKNMFESSEIFEAYVRIEANMYNLQCLHNDISKPQNAIESMVDQATGYIQSKRNETIKILRQIISDKQLIGADHSSDSEYLDLLLSNTTQP